SGRLQDVKVHLDLSHTYIGDLTVELVAPDRSSVKLHDKTGGRTQNIEKTFTLNDEALRALEGKEVNGRWRVRIIDSASRDAGARNGWQREIGARGSTHASDRYGEDKTKALYAGAGALARRLASAGDDGLQSRAFDLTADLVKTSPYQDVRTLLIA